MLPCETVRTKLPHGPPVWTGCLSTLKLHFSSDLIIFEIRNSGRSLCKKQDADSTVFNMLECYTWNGREGRALCYDSMLDLCGTWRGRVTHATVTRGMGGCMCCSVHDRDADVKHAAASHHYTGFSSSAVWPPGHCLNTQHCGRRFFKLSSAISWA